MVDLLSSDDTSPTPIIKKSCVVRIAKMAMLDKIVDTAEAAEPDDEKTDLDERMMCNEKDVPKPMTDVEENVGSLDNEEKIVSTN